MAARQLSLGPDVIKWLIPHRRPFLMVDRVIYFSDEPQPTLRAIKYLSGNESFFQGHFPAIMLMPGALAFEGLGQTNNLLAVILALRDMYKEKGHDPDEVAVELEQLELGYSLSLQYKPTKHKMLDELKQKAKESTYGLVGAANIKFLKPIFAGNQIEYESVLTGTFDNLLHYQVVATVGGNIKVKGTMSSVKGISLGNINGQY
jgi:3-hydroxymyristoyl/3-hydroxydecanoyl-(acyl carrier protein) dehydratase